MALASAFSSALAAFGVGLGPQVGVPQGQQVEGDEGGRRRLGQELDPRRGRMDALGQGIEIEAGRARR